MTPVHEPLELVKPAPVVLATQGWVRVCSVCERRLAGKNGGQCHACQYVGRLLAAYWRAVGKPLGHPHRCLRPRYVKAAAAA